MFCELEAVSMRDFTSYLRIDPNTFYKLLAKVKPYIQKQDTRMRDSVTAAARLEATLIFLSHGCTYTFLQYTARISKQSLSQMIPESRKAIYQVLKDDYLQV